MIMTREAKIAKRAIESANGLTLEKQNKIFTEALSQIGEVRRKKNPSVRSSSWDVTPRNRECSYGYVNNNGWV